MIDSMQLAPGYRISQLVKGSWQLAGGHGAISPATALADMRSYFEAGITTFDCADIYTGTEELIGTFRQSLPAAAQERLKVHTKFVPDLAVLGDIDKADIRRLIDRSRQRLQQDRLDLVQFHWWDYRQPRWLDTAHHLADLQASGLIHLLGATNFDVPHATAMCDAGVPLATMQTQYSLLDERPAGAMSELCGRTGMRLLCYGTIAGGFLSERWLDREAPVGDVENRSLAKYRLIIEDAGGWDWFQSLLQCLSAIGARHGTGIGAIATRWVLDRPYVAAAIIGVRSPAHLPQHASISAIILGDTDHRDIAAVLAQRHPLRGGVYELERDREGRHGRIMKYNLGAS